MFHISAESLNMQLCNKQMELYFKTIFFLIVTICLFGGVLPYLFSEESDIAVLFGIILGTMYVPFTYYLWRVKK